ncbi:DinB family protein [bacterium]|nr:DinB family protein [bacterium]
MKRVSETASPILWIAGHLTGVRFHVTSLLGGTKPFLWLKLFDKPFDPSRSYPTISEITTAWNEVANDLVDKMNQAPDDLLTKKLEYKLPHGDHTVRGACIFFAYHESWHLGQIAYIRKCFDLEGLVPY